MPALPAQRSSPLPEVVSQHAGVAPEQAGPPPAEPDGSLVAESPHTQMPPVVHVSLVPHATPHPPQLASSLFGFTHEPPQQI